MITGSRPLSAVAASTELGVYAIVASVCRGSQDLDALTVSPVVKLVVFILIISSSIVFSTIAVHFDAFYLSLTICQFVHVG